MILHVLCLSFGTLLHEQLLTLCFLEQAVLHWILSKCCLALQTYVLDV